MRVLRVLQGNVIGQEVRFRVHSVVLSFAGDDRDEVVGKRYRVTYLSAFSPIYTGELEIRPE